MKLKTTKKEVKLYYYRILSAGYCEMQYLLNYIKPFGYSSRAEGWACDYYEVGGCCISTGYSPIASQHMKDDYHLIREYDNKAKGLTANERLALLEELLEKLTIKESKQ